MSDLKNGEKYIGALPNISGIEVIFDANTGLLNFIASTGG